MAIDNEDTTGGSGLEHEESESERSERGLAALVEKYAGDETKPAAVTTPAGDRGNEGSDDADDAADDDADTEADGSDGNADSSDDDADAGDETDTGDAESDDDADDADDAADGEGDDDAESDDGDDDTSELAQALKRHGARLTLDDVPEKLRPVIEQKLKEMNAPFTRAMQELRSYRDEERQFRAEQQFRKENPALAIVELLAQDAALLEKVNDLLMPTMATEDEPSDAEQRRMKLERDALARTIADTRKRTGDAIEAAQKESAVLSERADRVEKYARGAVAKAGLPWTTAIERSLAAEITRKVQLGKEVDLSTAEIDAVVKEFRAAIGSERRRETRTASRQVVKARKANVAATVRAPQGRSPGVRPSQRFPKNATFEEKLKSTADRVMPGVE